MYKKLMIATDLSAVSRVLLDVAETFRKLGAQETLLTHTFTLHHLEELHSQYERLVLEKLEQEKDVLSKKGFRVYMKVPVGIPYQEIEKTAAAEKPDLLLIGSHGSSMAADMVLGSTAMEVIHNCRIPVLLSRINIRSKNEAVLYPEADASRLFSHILFPTDFSDVSMDAFSHLLEIAGKSKSKVTFLYARDNEKGTLEKDISVLGETEKNILANKKEALLKANPDCEITEAVYSGSPIRAIGQEVRDNKIPLIIMGSQGKGFLEEMILGSLSYKTARYVNASLLLVPRKSN